MTVSFVLDFLGGAAGDDLAEVHHGDVLADAHDDAHLVLDEEDREVEAILDEVYEVHELEDLAGIHARGGLVEEEEGWGSQARARAISTRRCWP